MFQDQSGCLGVLFTSADQGSYAVVTFWQNPADVHRLDTSRSYRETSAALSAAGYLRGEQTVELFAVEGGGVWSSLG
jgi:heme-degrading monooxygenase HmoA